MLKTITFLLQIAFLLLFFNCKNNKESAHTSDTKVVVDSLLLKKADSSFAIAFKTYELRTDLEKAKSYFMTSDSLYQILHIPHKIVESKLYTYSCSLLILDPVEVYIKPLHEALPYIKLLTSESDELIYKTYRFLGITNNRQTDFEASTFYHAKAMNIADAMMQQRKPNAKQFYFDTLHNLASVLEYTYDYKKAEEYYVKAIEFGEQNGYDLSHSRGRLFSLNMFSGQYDKIEQFLKDNQEHDYFKNAQLYTVYDFQSTIIDYFVNTGQFDKALKKTEELKNLVANSEQKDHFADWFLESRLSDIYFEMGNYQGVIKTLRRLDLNESYAQVRPEVKSLNQMTIARAFYELQEFDEAEKYIQKAIGRHFLNSYSVTFHDEIDIEKAERKRQTLLNNLLVKGKISLSIFHKTQDKQYYKTAMNTYESAHQLLKVLGRTSEEDAFFSDDEFKTLYGTLLNIYHELWKETPSKELFYKALNLSDESRYVTILNELKTLNRNKLFKNIPKTILKKEQELIKAIDSLEFVNSKTSIIMDSLTMEMSRLKTQLKGSYPKYYELQYGNDKPITSIITEQFNDINLIEYFWSNDAIYIFNKNGELTLFDKVPLTDDLTSHLETFMTSLRQSKNKPYKTSGAAIYTALFKKYIDSTKRTVVVLDDKLHLMPIESLWVPDQNNGHFLMEETTILRRNSIAQKIEKTTKQANKTLLFAPFASESSEANSVISSSMDEVQAIEKLFKSDTYINSDASKTNFLERVNDFPIVHLATHATINTRDPLKSKIHFYENVDVEPSKTSLRMEELYNLKLNSDLVTLSACETGVGEEVKGKGLLSMSSAFNYAGVSSTVMSLWKVPDRETSEIMVPFYKYLKDGLSKDEALHRSKLDFIKSHGDETLQHPFYWAGFVISGDASPIASGSNKLWFYIGFGFIALVVMILRKKIL